MDLKTMASAPQPPCSGLRVAANQSNYLPWKGYFDIIHDVDLFFFYDDVKYTKDDWRNRNIVKMGGSLRWITIPIGKEAVKQRICDVPIPSSSWQLKHWRTLNQCYSKCQHFARYAAYFEEFYCRHTWTNLSEMNQVLIRQVCTWLGMDVVFGDSRDLHLTGAKQERVLDFVEKVGATSFLAGPAARAYLDPAEFARRNTALHFKTYQYPEYPQGMGAFFHNVSIVDLLFRFGPDCTHYIWDHDTIAARPSSL
jgi:WbqC-like protein family